MPPGISAPRGVRWIYESFNKKMNRIVVRHADVIVAMHFGHEHHDNFRIYYGATGMFSKNKYMHLYLKIKDTLCLRNEFIFTSLKRSNMGLIMS
jgi:predicted metallo-beta-lactamase superfamily hydrolase